jgi:hypothetical protein
MRQVWTPVEVTNPDHPRKGTAGIVVAVDPAKTDRVVVKFDTDGVSEETLQADLRQLV